jgi:hypothetical protein
MSTEVIAALAGAIVGALLAGPVSYWFSKRLATQARADNLEALRIIEFNKAAAEFRASFVSETFLLQDAIATGNKKPTQIITSDVLLAHEKAMILFRPFINAENLVGFDAAWHQYKNTKDKNTEKNGHENRDIRKYAPNLGNLYIEHIKHMLDNFAAPI